MKIEEAIKKKGIGARGKVILYFFENEAKEDEVYSASELSVILRIPESTIKDIMRKWEIEGVKVPLVSYCSGKVRIYGLPKAITRYKALLKERVVTRR